MRKAPIEYIRSCLSTQTDENDLTYFVVAQADVIIEAVMAPARRYTIKEHQNMHGVVYQTARTDLLDLTNRGVLELQKQGKELVFRVPTDIGERLKRLEAGPRPS